MHTFPKHRRRWSWAAACCATAAIVGSVRAAPASQTDAVKTARQFAESLAKGRYDDAAKLYDETMAKALPVEKLKAAWEQVAASSGAFKSLGEPAASKEGGYDVVIIPAKFKNASLNLRIVVNDQRQVAGFFIQPGGALPAGEYQPPAYAKPDSCKEIDVEFGEAPWTVKGKLLRPNDRSIVPAVVLVHGSGPQDEDETIGPNKPFRDLAAGLAANGIAVLRYQKRTYAHRLQLAVKKTISVREETIDDALAAVKFLRGNSGVDKTKIFVLGHSMGATLAPHIAADDKDVAGIVLLAGTARDFYDVLDDQLAYIASLPGPNQQANRRALEDVRTAVKRVRAGDKPEEILILGVPASYWNELNDYGKRSLRLLKDLERPVFIAGGGRDYQITQKDFDLYQQGLGKRPNVAFRWYERLNHLFMTGEKKATPEEFLEAKNVDALVIEDLTKWIKAQAEPAGDARG
jgi:pimeloyl-ACP methyl ester carboxylesterase